MRQLSTPVKLLIALVAVVVIGQTMNVIDAAFGTDWSARSGLFFALLAAAIFAAYLYYAFRSGKK
jgi:threonine/homoserine efflux transporter RhtA